MRYFIVFVLGLFLGQHVLAATPAVSSSAGGAANSSAMQFDQTTVIASGQSITLKIEHGHQLDEAQCATINKTPASEKNAAIEAYVKTLPLNQQAIYNWFLTTLQDPESMGSYGAGVVSKENAPEKAFQDLWRMLNSSQDNLPRFMLYSGGQIIGMVRIGNTASRDFIKQQIKALLNTLKIKALLNTLNVLDTLNVLNALDALDTLNDLNALDTLKKSGALKEIGLMTGSGFVPCYEIRNTDAIVDPDIAGIGECAMLLHKDWHKKGVGSAVVSMFQSTILPFYMNGNGKGVKFSDQAPLKYLYFTRSPGNVGTERLMDSIPLVGLGQHKGKLAYLVALSKAIANQSATAAVSSAHAGK